MKRLMKRKLKGHTGPGLDPVLSGVLGVGLAGATGGYLLTLPDPVVPENIEADSKPLALPPLGELLPFTPSPFDAPVSARPPDPVAPHSDPSISALSNERAYAEDAVPQLAWQIGAPQKEPTGNDAFLQAHLMLPEAPMPVMAEEFVPPPETAEAFEQGEEEMDEDNETPSATPMQADGDLPRIGDILDAPTPQEAERWEALFGRPVVPQSQFIFLDPVTLLRETSTERKLLDIVFGDAILDARGVTMAPHAALEIRNGNELWLRGGIDLTDPYFVPQLYIQFFAVADPSSSAGLVLYVMDELPAWLTEPPVDNALDDDDPFEDPDYNPNGNFIVSDDDNAPASGNQPSGNQPAGGQNNPNAMEEQGHFGDTAFEYHQDPDII